MKLNKLLLTCAFAASALGSSMTAQATPLMQQSHPANPSAIAVRAAAIGHRVDTSASAPAVAVATAPMTDDNKSALLVVALAVCAPLAALPFIAAKPKR